jgi:hypothetical protein
MHSLSLSLSFASCPFLHTFMTRQMGKDSSSIAIISQFYRTCKREAKKLGVG